MLLVLMVEHRLPPPDPTVLNSKLGQYPDEASGSADGSCPPFHSPVSSQAPAHAHTCKLAAENGYNRSRGQLVCSS